MNKPLTAAEHNRLLAKKRYLWHKEAAIFVQAIPNDAEVLRQALNDIDKVRQALNDIEDKLSSLLDAL